MPDIRVIDSKDELTLGKYTHLWKSQKGPKTESLEEFFRIEFVPRFLKNI